ncbi:MAG: polyphenol oxidase family protein [Actinomycetota bacterium]
MAFDRRPLGDSGSVLVSREMEEAGFLVAFSERGGGASEPPFATLNMSYAVGDDAQAVGGNRRLLLDALGIGEFAIGGQVHGTKLVRIGAKLAGAGYAGQEGVIGETDGLYAGSPRIPMAVATADCAPVVVASESEQLVAIVHAGWRGLAGGIVQRAAELFQRPAESLALIGPAAGVCHYEVGEDVAFAVAGGSDAGAVTERRDGRTFLDLASTIEATLRDSGVKRIAVEGSCTIHDDRFFSHRRDGVTGRQLAVAMRMGPV